MGLDILKWAYRKFKPFCFITYFLLLACLIGYTGLILYWTKKIAELRNKLPVNRTGKRTSSIIDEPKSPEKNGEPETPDHNRNAEADKSRQRSADGSSRRTADDDSSSEKQSISPRSRRRRRLGASDFDAPPEFFKRFRRFRKVNKMITPRIRGIRLQRREFRPDDLHNRGKPPKRYRKRAWYEDDDDEAVDEPQYTKRIKRKFESTKSSPQLKEHERKKNKAEYENVTKRMKEDKKRLKQYLFI